MVNQGGNYGFLNPVAHSSCPLIAPVVVSLNKQKQEENAGKENKRGLAGSERNVIHRHRHTTQVRVLSN